MAVDRFLHRRADILLLLAVIAGAAIGMTMSEKLGPVALSRVSTGLDGYLYAVTGDGQTDRVYIFFHALIQNTQILLLLFLSGFSLVGLPFNYGLTMFRTICAFFTYGCIARRYGFLGYIGAGVAVLVPAALSLCLLASASAASARKAVLDFAYAHGAKPPETAYLRRYTLLWLGMLGVSFLDAYFTPAVFGVFGGMIG